MYARSIRPTLRPVFTRPTLLPHVRFQSQWPFPKGRSQRPQYNHFNNVQSTRYLWQTNQRFRIGVGIATGATIIFIASNIEKVPVSGRWRFNWVSARYEEEMGKQQYQQLMQAYQRDILPDWHPDVKMVRKVLQRLTPNSGLEGQEWEVHVINDPEEMNAFVIPGGKVFVFSGLLPICSSPDGLATILGHEIAHNVAHHSAENYSRLSLIIPLAWLASYAFDFSGHIAYTLLEYAYQRPGSRTQESEADYIGLMMMARSCYNVEEVLGVWERIKKMEKVKVPQFLSTHPSSHNRLGKMREWLPQAREVRAGSECGVTSGYVDDFQRAFGGGGKDSGFW